MAALLGDISPYSLVLHMLELCSSVMTLAFRSIVTNEQAVSFIYHH